MASAKEYENLIRAYDDWDKLKTFWQGIQDKSTPDWEAGKALEYFILRCFEKEGAEVRYPYSVSNVEQIDGVIYIENIACIIECKDKTVPLNFEPIAKLRSQLMRRPSAVIGSLFSRSEFTTSALSLLNSIQPQTILLWENAEIDYCLKSKAFCTTLIKKYRAEIEYGGYYRYSALGDTSGENE
jgi:hypothetical protein